MSDRQISNNPSDSPLRTRLCGSTLVVDLPAEWPVLSWAPFNGGDGTTSCIFNHQVTRAREIKMPEMFFDLIEEHKLPKDAVGLLTGAEVKEYCEFFIGDGQLWVHALVTVGIENARSPGDLADSPEDWKMDPSDQRDNHGESNADAGSPLHSGLGPLGTVNLIVASNALPHLSGRAEALHLSALAKATAFFDLGVVSVKSGKPSPGTGTDCIVIASSGEVDENYCGMHTRLGEWIGKAVYQCTHLALADWFARNKGNVG